MFWHFYSRYSFVTPQLHQQINEYIRSKSEYIRFKSEYIRSNFRHALVTVRVKQLTKKNIRYFEHIYSL